MEVVLPLPVCADDIIGFDIIIPAPAKATVFIKARRFVLIIVVLLPLL